MPEETRKAFVQSIVSELVRLRNLPHKAALLGVKKLFRQVKHKETGGGDPEMTYAIGRVGMLLDLKSVSGHDLAVAWDHAISRTRERLKRVSG